MNKLKMSLALIALIIPLLLCAKKRNIEFIKHGNHRIPVESFIPVKAFFDDCNKELTIEFAQDWEAVTIEIKSKEGYVVYRNLYIPHSNSSLSSFPQLFYPLMTRQFFCDFHEKSEDFCVS